MSSERGESLLNEQVAAGMRGDFQRGWEIAEELQCLSPEWSRAAFNRGWYEMWRGNLLKGLELFENGRKEKTFGNAPLQTTKPVYDGQDLRGKHLLMVSEGGLGDEIISIRFAKKFAELGAHVTVSCDPFLKSVFARVEGVSAVVGHKSAADVYHDFWVPGMSAARVLKTEYRDLSGAPYLSVSETHKTKWSEYFQDEFSEDRRPRIGLRFYGNPDFQHEQQRRFSKEGLILAMDERPWVNLQKEESKLRLETWEDTLAVVAQLDLVITSCTSVAHASAALGKETWVLVPLLPYYVWALPGERSPWYQSVRLFRQKKPGDWSAVFAEVSAALNRHPSI